MDSKRISVKKLFVLIQINSIYRVYLSWLTSSTYKFLLSCHQFFQHAYTQEDLLSVNQFFTLLIRNKPILSLKHLSPFEIRMLAPTLYFLLRLLLANLNF